MRGKRWFARFSTGVYMLCLAALLLLSGCDRGASIAPIAPDGVILAFGDSLTWGTGAPRDSAYPAVLEKLLHRRVVNAGVPGDLSEGALRRLPETLAENRPALVIICIGGNDFLHRSSLDQLSANLRGMIEMCRTAGADVVLVGVPQPGLLPTSPSLYKDLAAEYALPYEGEMLTAILTERTLKSDTIHPNAAGYARMARTLAELIEKAQR